VAYCGGGLYLCAGISLLCSLAARQVVELNKQRIVPAVRMSDGVYFIPPTKLFSSAITSRRSSVPPPGVLWLVIDAVLAGAVQDFVLLVA